jgi:hypothetical protein
MNFSVRNTKYPAIRLAAMGNPTSDTSLKSITSPLYTYLNVLGEELNY